MAHTQILRDAPPGSVGIVFETEPVRADLLQVRRLGDRIVTIHDAILGHLRASTRLSVLRAIDAFDGDEPDERLLVAVIRAAASRAMVARRATDACDHPGYYVDDIAFGLVRPASKEDS